MKKGLLKHIITAIFIVLILLFTYTATVIRYYGKEYYETPSDAAIILGAGTSKGKISYVFEQRILHAVDLYKRKKVLMLIFTGGYGQGQTLSDSRAAKNYAIQLGVPEDRILIEEASTVTYTNIKNAKRVMAKNHLHSALLVSDPYHMKRAMAMCEKMGIRALPSPTPTSMYRSGWPKFDFLLRETINYWGFLVLKV